MSKGTGPFLVIPGSPARDVVDTLILRTVKAAGGNRAHAARLLGLNVKTIYHRLRRMKERA